jgi:hypothetical protein
MIYRAEFTYVEPLLGDKPMFNVTDESSEFYQSTVGLERLVSLGVTFDEIKWHKEEEHDANAES